MRRYRGLAHENAMAPLKTLEERLAQCQRDADARRALPQGRRERQARQAIAADEDAPEGWRATSTTDVDEECEVVGESAVREEIKRAVVEDTFEMVVSRVVRAE